MDNPVPFNFPEVLDQSNVYEGMYTLRKDRLRITEEDHYDYYTLVGREAATMVVAETQAGQLVVNHEYRHPTGKALLSLPGGVLESGEEALVAAERELLEETGYTADSFECMGIAYPLPGLYPQRITYVHARGARPAGAPNRELSEYIHTELYTLPNLFEQIARGAPVDGILCTALFYYNLHKAPKR